MSSIFSSLLLHMTTFLRHAVKKALKKLNSETPGTPSASSLLRRGLHEVSSEGKVSAQGVMDFNQGASHHTARAHFYSGNFM
jgi:hypothetical protein